jgi:hypothetical protein
MVYLVAGIIVALLLYAVAKAAAGNRYANMTAEQFEQEAKRSSKMGAAVTGFQKIVDPGHRVEYAQEQTLRIEADTAESGDRPQTAPLDGRNDGIAHSELERNIVEEG